MVGVVYRSPSILLVLLAVAHLTMGVVPISESMHCRVTGEQMEVCCCTGLDLAQWRAVDAACACCDAVTDERVDSPEHAVVPRVEREFPDTAGAVVALLPIPSVPLLATPARRLPCLAPSLDPPVRRPLYLQYAALLI